MTLGEYIKEYREKMGISQRQFALNCDLSNGYIAMLEKNTNPSTGQPIKVKVDTLKKIAAAMNMSLHELSQKANMTIIDLSVGTDENASAPTDEHVAELLRLFAELDQEHQETLMRVLRGLLAEQKATRRP